MSTRTRVAILGGGVGALSAAFALTEIDPKGETYDITIHQLGWRLGGQIASGRNAASGQRIEEHGLHVWSGFYENAFTMMRMVFKALDRPAGAPQATIGDAFKRENQMMLAELFGDEYLPWPLWFEPDANPDVFPGSDDLWRPSTVMPSMLEALRRTVGWIKYNHEFYSTQWTGDYQQETANAIAAMPPRVRATVAPLAGSTHGKAHPLLAMALRLVERLDTDVDAQRDAAEAGVTALLDAYRGLLKTHYGDGAFTTQLRRVCVFTDIGLRIVTGILRHGCLTQGLYVLDRFEFRAFLSQDAPLDRVSHNAVVTAMYQWIFASRAGLHDDLSACTAVEALLRMFLCYQGAFFYKTTAGMGDTVCGPLYQLLRRRGVRFKFFHKVVSLEPSADGASIAAILIDEQAALRGPQVDYQPLVTVNGLPSWPSEPLWRQIEHGEALAAAGVNFESAYSKQPPPAARLRLRRGADFDQVILAIPVGALGGICRPLTYDTTNPARAQAWSDMLLHLATVRTQALQIWFEREIQTLGGPYVAPVTGPAVAPAKTGRQEIVGPTITGLPAPFVSYADMSQTLLAEAQHAPRPQGVVNLCAIMSDTEAPDNQEAATAKVRQNALDWMKQSAHILWNNIGQGQDVRWDMLYCATPAEGEARLDQQYWRANISPAERYVLSLPGTLKYRMDPGGSGYANLFLAGVWTTMPDINAGSVEGATMSGLGAAAALSGVYIPIVSAWSLYGPLQKTQDDIIAATRSYEHV